MALEIKNDHEYNDYKRLLDFRTNFNQTITSVGPNIEKWATEDQIKIAIQNYERNRDHERIAKIANRLLRYEKQFLLLAYEEHDFSIFLDRDDLFINMPQTVGNAKECFRANRTETGKKVVEYLKAQEKANQTKATDEFRWGIFNSDGVCVAKCKHLSDATTVAKEAYKFWHPFVYHVRELSN